MGSMSSSSSTSSTTNIMIAPAPPTGLARGAQLVAVGARGLEAVMAVGEHQTASADRRADLGDARRVVDRAELVDHAVVVDAGAEQGVGLESLGEARRRG